MKCKICYSYAINHNLHDRDGSDPDLCDVCYWKKRAEAHAQLVEALKAIIKEDDDELKEKNIGLQEPILWRRLPDCAIAKAAALLSTLETK